MGDYRRIAVPEREEVVDKFSPYGDGQFSAIDLRQEAEQSDVVRIVVSSGKQRQVAFRLDCGS